MTTMKIGTLELKLPSPYFPGQQMTASEAAILNAELHHRLKKNIKNRWGHVASHPDGDGYTWLLDIQQYIREYTLNGLNELEVVSFIIALDLVRHQLKASGKPLKNYAKSALNDAARKVLEGPKAVEIRALAKRRIIFIQEAAVEELERKHG